LSKLAELEPHAMTPLLDPGKGFCLLFRGESYWLDLDVKTKKVTVDLQHHGLMGQPGEVERVGDGVWVEERITERSGVLAGDAFDAAEVALRAHLEEARGKN
jgi:hypothetical protein